MIPRLAGLAVALAFVGYFALGEWAADVAVSPARCPVTREDQLRADSVALTRERDSLRVEVRRLAADVANARALADSWHRQRNVAAGLPPEEE